MSAARLRRHVGARREVAHDEPAQLGALLELGDDLLRVRVRVRVGVRVRVRVLELGETAEQSVVLAAAAKSARSLASGVLGASARWATRVESSRSAP